MFVELQAPKEKISNNAPEEIIWALPCRTKIGKQSTFIIPCIFKYQDKMGVGFSFSRSANLGIYQLYEKENLDNLLKALFMLKSPSKINSQVFTNFLKTPKEELTNLDNDPRFKEFLNSLTLNYPKLVQDPSLALLKKINKLGVKINFDRLQDAFNKQNPYLYIPTY